MPPRKAAPKKPAPSPIPDRPILRPVSAFAPCQPPPPALAHTDIRAWNTAWEAFNFEMYGRDSGFSVNRKRQAEQYPIFLTERQLHEAMFNQKHLYLVTFVYHVLEVLLGGSQELNLPKKLSSLPTPPGVKASLKAKGFVPKANGFYTPTPESLRDLEFRNYAGQWQCEECDQLQQDIAEAGGPKMLLCGPCKELGRAAAYCNSTCEKKHWKIHKKHCGKPLSDTTTIPIFSRDPDDNPSPHKTNPLLRQQIAVHKRMPQTQWAVLVQGGVPGPGTNLCLAPSKRSIQPPSGASTRPTSSVAATSRTTRPRDARARLRSGGCASQKCSSARIGDGETRAHHGVVRSAGAVGGEAEARLRRELQGAVLQGVGNDADGARPADA